MEHAAGEQAPDKDEVHDARRLTTREADQELDCEQRSRRNEHQEQREEDDLGAARPANREERGVTAEDVEQRLRERKAGEHGELGAAHEGGLEEGGLLRARDAATLVSPPAGGQPNRR